MVACVSWKTVLVSIPDQASTGSNQVIDGFGWKDSVDGSFKRRLAKFKGKIMAFLQPFLIYFYGTSAAALVSALCCALPSSLVRIDTIDDKQVEIWNSKW